MKKKKSRSERSITEGKWQWVMARRHYKQASEQACKQSSKHCNVFSSPITLFSFLWFILRHCQVLWLNSLKWWDDSWMMNQKEFRRKRSWFNRHTSTGFVRRDRGNSQAGRSTSQLKLEPRTSRIQGCNFTAAVTRSIQSFSFWVSQATNINL